MRELNVNEIQEVDGGNDSLVFAGFAITGIGAGLTAFAVGGALAGTFGAAYGAATALGADTLGRAIGGALYNAFNGQPGRP